MGNWSAGMTLARKKAGVVVAASIGALLISTSVGAVTTTFFDNSQTPTVDTSATFSDTLVSAGYVFVYSMDKLFTGGVGLTTPIGRPVSVTWPTGLHAQAVTTPSSMNASVTISRVDGNVFDLNSFSAKLLANTAGAGGDFEVVPWLNGQDTDPILFFASGNAGNSFTYAPTATPGYSNPYSQTTAALRGYDKYTINLYVDFALTGATLVDASVAAPIPEPSNHALMLAGLILTGAVVRRRKCLKQGVPPASKATAHG